MSEFEKVSTLTDLNNLDQDEVLQGYRSGWDGLSEPESDKSRSFWHGWRNAMIDKQIIPSDEECANLAEEYVRRMRSH